MCVYVVSLTLSNLNLLCEMLEDAEDNWIHLGAELYVPIDIQMCLADMLEDWLLYHDPSWSELASALRAIGHPTLADQIQSGKGFKCMHVCIII